MSDPITSARTARENLARGLAALQSPGVPPALMEVAEPIAAAMSALHRIESSAGAATSESAPVALESVRRALALLQVQPPVVPELERAVEAVAGSLSLLHGLAQQAAAAPAQPAPAPAQPAAPAPQPIAAPQPAPAYPAAPYQPPPAQTAPQQPVPAQQARSPYQPPPAADLIAAQQPAPAAPQQPGVPATPPWQQPWQQPAPAAPPAQPGPDPAVLGGTVVMGDAAAAAGPAPGPAPPAQPGWSAPGSPAAAPGWGAAPAAAPQPGWGQPAPQPAAAPQVQPAAYQPAAAPQPAYQAPAAPYPAAPQQPARRPEGQGEFIRVEAELGAHSVTNFYKGLSGNDVIDDGGIFVATYQIPPIGQNLIVHVSLPGGYEFEAKAVVRWTREHVGSSDHAPPGYGAQFSDITPEGRQLVYRYVRNREPLFHDDL